jgi:hypothetical protein
MATPSVTRVRASINPFGSPGAADAVVDRSPNARLELLLKARSTHGRQ